MKVIVINDTDGHTTALHWSKENLRKVLEAYVEWNESEISDANPAAFLAGNPDAEAIEAYLLDKVEDVNCRHGSCHILEPCDWSFRYNPFN